MHRYQLGSRLLWLKTLVLGLYAGAEWWPGIARAPLEKAIWGIIVVAFVLWWSVGPIGYADDRGLHYRKLIRFSHVPWPEVKQAEWDAERMVLFFTVDSGILAFKYRGIAPLFGSRERPEAVNFAERKLTEGDLSGRFVCKTSLAVS